MSEIDLSPFCFVDNSACGAEALADAI
jgi:hypothetical protein